MPKTFFYCGLCYFPSRSQFKFIWNCLPMCTIPLGVSLTHPIKYSCAVSMCGWTSLAAAGIESGWTKLSCSILVVQTDAKTDASVSCLFFSFDMSHTQWNLLLLLLSLICLKVQHAMYSLVVICTCFYHTLTWVAFIVTASLPISFLTPGINRLFFSKDSVSGLEMVVC